MRVVGRKLLLHVHFCQRSCMRKVEYYVIRHVYYVKWGNRRVVDYECNLSFFEEVKVFDNTTCPVIEISSGVFFIH